MSESTPSESPPGVPTDAYGYRDYRPAPEETAPLASEASPTVPVRAPSDYSAPPPGSPGYGQPAYGQPAYSPPVYAAPAYGQPAYVQPADGPPGYSPAPYPPPPAAYPPPQYPTAAPPAAYPTPGYAPPPYPPGYGPVPTYPPLTAAGYGQAVPAVEHAYAQMYGRRPGRGPAITALVLGILAILGCWIPLLSYGAVIVAVLGLVFAIVGVRRAFGRGLAIAGLVLSAVGLAGSVALSIYWTGVFVDAYRIAEQCAREHPGLGPAYEQCVTDRTSGTTADAPGEPL